MILLNTKDHETLLQHIELAQLGKYCVDDVTYELAAVAREQMSDELKDDDLIMMLAFDDEGKAFIEWDGYGRMYVDERISHEGVVESVREWTNEFAIMRGLDAVESWRDIMEYEYPVDYERLTERMITQINESFEVICAKLEEMR